MRALASELEVSAAGRPGEAGRGAADRSAVVPSLRHVQSRVAVGERERRVSSAWIIRCYHIMFPFVRQQLARRSLAALGFSAILSLAVLGGVASAAGGGGGGGGGHGGGFGGGFGHGGGGPGAGRGFNRGGGFADGRGHGFDGHGFHHDHFHGHDFVVVPFGWYGPYPYDTYCTPASAYYDPSWCWDYYDD
jgi:hypothetical protein